MIFAIDPGTEKSAWLIMSDEGIVRFGIDENQEVVEHVRALPADYTVVIEMMASYAMPVGRDVFETCVWIGRFIQAARCKWARIYRRDVKLHLCGNSRAKDANIRQAILDLYPPTGGGKTPQVGTKKQPGPLYGVSRDVWAALGIALTYISTKTKTKGTYLWQENQRPNPTRKC